MEELYDEIRDDPLFGRLFEIANVHTAEQFGLDVPDGVYEEMAGAIDDGDEWEEIRTQDWFASAQATAGEQSFFHWELEYPEVFFGEDGEKSEDAGFDAVIGNPPYGAEFSKTDQRYLDKKYTVRGIEYDSYVFFAELGRNLLRDSGEFGYIIPTIWTKLENNQPIREYLLKNAHLRQIVGCKKIFKSTGSEPIVDTLMLLFRNKSTSGETEIKIVEGTTIESRLANLAESVS